MLCCGYLTVNIWNLLNRWETCSFSSQLMLHHQRWTFNLQPAGFTKEKKTNWSITSVCTMWGLCSLRLFTVWKTSRIPSAFTLSRTVLSAQKVPVRPAPALGKQHKKVDETVPVQTCRSNLSETSGGPARPTCSARWWGGSRTAAAASAPQRWCWSSLYRRQGFPPLASRGNETDARLEPCFPAQTGNGGMKPPAWRPESSWSSGRFYRRPSLIQQQRRKDLTPS